MCVSQLHLEKVWKSFIIVFFSTALFGNVMYWGMGDMSVCKTFVIIWLTVGWEMPDLSPISHWNVPMDKTPSVERTWVCIGMLLLPLQNWGKLLEVINWANEIDWWAHHTRKRRSCGLLNHVPCAKLCVSNLQGRQGETFSASLQSVFRCAFYMCLYIPCQLWRQ